eukprot:CAMPEP_0174315680 /NCGR_PEP_ID=MMETSP0810-20121108/6435_1 /TAXON_ID=73025 ORGANISM="Eutreptiella gymnastica-like, Strain CCMP1594" /NCGR_SAMPLE_ID=MMETSP0810 /ASSEMBLY_ACC=CAM_ASM_000659 /LENGTH=56 /DNA_ID=CAMNT_0015425121 /DNA_START=860 /DNA_END=1030 /DNA_ORIENTATION=-
MTKPLFPTTTGLHLTSMTTKAVVRWSDRAIVPRQSRESAKRRGVTSSHWGPVAVYM